MRDKYFFVPAVGAPASHANLQLSLQALFNANKVSRKQLEDTAWTAFLADLAANAALPAPLGVHPILHRYEQAHLRAGGDWGRIQGSLGIRYRSMNIQVVAEPNLPPRSRIDATIHGNSAPVGHVFHGMNRFVLLNPQPPGLLATVYERRGNGNHRHYVFLPTSGTHVRRFVVRGLNAADVMNTDQNLPLRAPQQAATAVHDETTVRTATRHPHAVGTAMTEREQLLSHTRGWQKRYISTGVSTARPAISTRGQPFQSLYGTTAIDLAKVPPADIFDLHSADVAPNWIGPPANDILIHPHRSPAANYADEQYLALRDVIRTRELVIKFQVPQVALSTAPLGFKILGIGSSTNGYHNNHSANLITALPANLRARIVQEEHLDFRINNHHGNLRWHMVLFQTAFHCILAYNQINVPAPHVKRFFNQYQMIRPPGMV